MRHLRTSCIFLDRAGPGAGARSSDVPLVAGGISGPGFAGVSSNVLGPSIHDEEEALDTSAGQFVRPAAADEQGQWRARPAQVHAAQGLVGAQAITLGSMARTTDQQAP